MVPPFILLVDAIPTASCLINSAKFLNKVFEQVSTLGAGAGLPRAGLGLGLGVGDAGAEQQMARAAALSTTKPLMAPLRLSTVLPVQLAFQSVAHVAAAE